MLMCHGRASKSQRTDPGLYHHGPWLGKDNRSLMSQLDFGIHPLLDLLGPSKFIDWLKFTRILVIG
jgi:hypothetical protein